MAKKSRELKLPPQLLDRIGGDDFDDSQWRESHNFGQKRKSRKESRKELRQSKKQKRVKHSNDVLPDKAVVNGSDKHSSAKGTKTPAKSQDRKSHKTEQAQKPNKSDQFMKPFVSAHDEELRRKDEEEANYYAKKLGLKSLKLSNENDGLDDILSDLDFDRFSGSDNASDEEAGMALNEDSDAESDAAFDDDVYSDEDNEDGSMTAEETMAKLAALKKNRKNTNEDASLRIVKEDDLSDLSDSNSEVDDIESNEEDSSETELTAEETMAKLAALKKGKREHRERESDLRIVKEDELDDSLSDFDDVDDSESGGEGMTAEETMAKLKALKGNGVESSNLGADDDSLSDGDFEDSDGDEGSDDDEKPMTAEETMAKLAALKGKKLETDTNVPSDDDSVASDFSESDSSEDEDDANPYVPPKRRNNVEKDSTSDEKSESKEDSETVQAMRRSFKRALNKLTESTLPHTTNEIEMVFVKNSRAEASEVLTEQLLELVDGPQPLQHTLYTVYAGLVAALYQSIGIGFAAHFIQVVVEQIVKDIHNASNLLNLLIECYSFHVVSSRLPYDLMKKFLDDIDGPETLAPVELLLIVIRNGGSQLRSDDPVALKDVIILLQQRMQQLGGVGNLSARMRFLVDAVVALKNNRQKPMSEIVVSLRHRLRKMIQGSFNQKNGDRVKEPLQVGLNDILDSKTRGKWWLVGASWKGNSTDSQAGDKNDTIDIDMNDEFGASTPDWLELAKKQRLNTDVRRAIFVALMGAEDYLDACLRIDKLGLKNKQERDVPHVILHCLVQEPYYNPYYALVAGKQCGRHSTMKTFQFRLWDWFSSEPSGNPQVAMHYGRFYAALVSQRVMPLDVLKAADFLGGSSDIQIFLEFFCVTLYKDLAKQAEKAAKQASSIVHISSGSDVDRDGKELTLLLSKVRDPNVLGGLEIINKSITNSESIQSAKDKKRVAWAAQLTTAVVEELVHKTK